MVNRFKYGESVDEFTTFCIDVSRHPSLQNITTFPFNSHNVVFAIFLSKYFSDNNLLFNLSSTILPILCRVFLLPLTFKFKNINSGSLKLSR